jgi:ElaB/YqjD/DUF883 family membrane-anchored ribosome-binding protein
MPNKNQSAGSTLPQQARDAAPSTTDAVNNTSDNGQLAPAQTLDSTAAAVHDTAEDHSRGQSIPHFAPAAANRLGNGGDHMRMRDAKRMVAEAESFIKHNPAPALLVAAAFGFIVGRTLARV